MKKLLFLIALFIIPTCIFAVNLDKPKVTKLDATTDKFEIKYNGEVEEGSYAVMCKLLNDEEELDLLSSPVDDNKFDGTFTVTENGKYIVSCANYEGGETKIVDVTVEDKEEPKQEVKEEVKEENPKTGDNIITYIVVFSISIVGLCCIILLKKRKN